MKLVIHSQTSTVAIMLFQSDMNCFCSAPFHTKKIVAVTSSKIVWKQKQIFPQIWNVMENIVSEIIP